MISERNGDVKVQSTMNGERIAMDIAAGAKAHIMAILTNLYSNRKGAVIREYSTNAYDSHVMAGTSDRPIEVTTPDPNKPLGSRTLRIRDYGIGLSVDDIHAIYSQYGESTKNDSNDYNGMLGLGSKSGLTYTNSFVVTAVKNGTRVAVAVGLDEDGLPQMTVMETVATTDPNGVEVVIPVKGGDDFRDEAARFYRYWRKGTVKVNGVEPADFRDSALHVCDEDGIRIWIDENASTSFVVMGNVAYPVANDALAHGMSTGALIVEVPIGSVNFTPAREALMDTARTRATLAQVEGLFFKHIQAATQRDIDKAANGFDAIDRMFRWERTMAKGARGGSYTYQGRDIPRNFSHGNVKIMRDGVPADVPGMVIVPQSKHKLAQHQRNNAVSSETFKHTIWFTGYDLATFNANHRKKIDQWLDSQPADYQTEFRGTSYYRSDGRFVLLSETPPMDWIDPSRVVPWATIAAIRLNPSTGGNGYRGAARLTGSYDLIEDGAHKEEVLASDISTTKPLLYMRGNRYESRFYEEALNHFYPKGYTLVYMGQNRITKFERDFPRAEKVHDACIRLAKAWVKSIPSDMLDAMAMQDEYDAIGNLREIDPARVDDPALKNAGRIAKIDLTQINGVRKIVNKTLGRQAIQDQLKWTNPLHSYPLYNRRVLHSNPDHVYHYLNTAYAATI